jgi:molecular chaperone GrpE
MSNNNNEEFEDEIEFTDEDGQRTQIDKIKKIKQDLKDAKEESQKNLDGWQRALADYANLQKTSTSQLREVREYSLQSFVEELLPVLDSFEMAMKNKQSWEAVSDNWRKGVEYIYNQLKAVLVNNGIEEISNLKDKFNPEIHHAVEEIETDDETKDHTISEIVQKGYRTSKNIIRPAQIKIFVKK